MKDKETPYIPGMLNTYVGDGKVGELAHMLYKKGHERSGSSITELLLPDGTLTTSKEIEYCGYDGSVKVELTKGFIYLGIGVLHK
jgi:hypothetical protein